VSGPRSGRRGPALLLGAALLLLQAGCASLPPRQPLPPEAHRLIDLLHRRRQEFTDLRAQAQITIRRGTRVERLAGVLVLKAPASLRFEALTPWGQPFLVLAGNGDTVTIWEVARGRAFVGPASPGATERWLGFPLEAADLVGLLAGVPAPLGDPYAGEVLPADSFGPSLRLSGPGGAQRIWLDPESGVARQVELPGPRPALATFETRAPGEPPLALTLAALDSSLSVSIRYRDPRTDTGAPPDLFTLRLPEEVKVQQFR
jgi:outer membrane lipoprotein-sorting protein